MVLELENILKEKLNVLKILDNLRIEFGIFDDVGNLKEKVTIYNLDNTTSEYEMSLADIMYFTEKGTIALPPRPVLNRVLQELKRELEPTLNKICQRVMKDNWQRADVIQELELLNFRINTIMIPNAITTEIASNNYISGLIEGEEDKKYIFDLKKLQKFIKSKIFFTT